MKAEKALCGVALRGVAAWCTTADAQTASMAAQPPS